MIYSREQIIAALRMLDDLQSIGKTMKILGYPNSRESLYNWIKRREEYLPDSSALRQEEMFIPRPRVDLEAIKCCVEEGCSVQSISQKLGYSVSIVVKWCKIMKQEGTISIMPEKEKKTRNKNETPSKKEVDVLKQQVYEMQLQIDVLTEVINVLKKDPGIDITSLRNSEKAVIVDALRKKYPLPRLLKIINLSRSSYYYQVKIKSKTDKYKEIEAKIIKYFRESTESYGYRRIHCNLKNEGIVISEKVVRRLMKKLKLIVKVKRKRKYSSYQGEISPAVANVINRDFHADAPNKKWLTDITEFNIPAGKVYLSPIIDCFDGLPVCWKISTSPNARLVNTMLDEAISLLKEHEKPIIHSDRGCHYRWPGWIKRMEKAQLTRSMSRKGCSPDNSACEGFFGRLKNEMFYGRSWDGVSIASFMKKVNDYILWYCEKRIKMSLGGKSPLEYRRSLGIAA